MAKKQGYNDRKDEQLGMTRGKKSKKKMSEAGRRKVAKATRKPKGSYGLKKKKTTKKKKQMPTKKVKGGYRWGSSGKVYKTKKQADAQGRAIYASG